MDASEVEERLEEIRQEGWEEGYDAGFADGHDVGFEEGASQENPPDEGKPDSVG